MKFKKVLTVTIVIYFLSLDSFAQIDGEKVLKDLGLDPKGKTEVIKEFPEDFPQTLISRGKPTIYTRENSNNFEYIDMPVGGIGAGMLYLGGDGQLWFWDIFNQNYKYGDLKGEEGYKEPYIRSNPDEDGSRMINQGFSITVKANEKEITKLLNRDGFKDIEFLGQYPVGQVTYRDREIPLTVKLEVFSPFIPLDIENSIYPATIMNYMVTNTSNEGIDVELKGWLENAVLIESRKDEELSKDIKLKNRVQFLDNKGVRLECLAVPSSPSKVEALKGVLDYGTMSLTVLGEPKNLFASEEGSQDLNGQTKIELVGHVGKKVHLNPNETKEIRFILTWHFKNTRNEMDIWWTEENIEYFNYTNDHYYSTKFRDAMAVSDHLISNIDNLTSKTLLWRDTWYDSSLPYWFLDRTFLNASILASCTSKLFDGFLFYGSEGSYQGTGTCNHVWGYVQAMGRLFPSLEKSLHENVDFRAEEDGGAMLPSGEIRHRWMSINGMAVDGQASTIMRTYLTHQMSKDESFLTNNYSGIKKAMQGLTEANDADHDGILTGPQHNTLDAAWYGKVTWLSLHYTAALRATALMAEEMGDTAYAQFCRNTADKGKSYIEKHLFNGEYFIHEADPEHPESPGTYEGVEYSQLFGQSWAYQVGIGEILDPHKTKTALESIWRYNFTTDVGPFREAHKPGRWYAMPGEGGLIACTWPYGGQEALLKGNPRFAAYNNECQNGYEYAATSLMMWHDMPYHSLAHIWYMHNDRYHASKRNPWAEVEWGIHYARSMASYGHFVAVSGFEYHGPKGFMAFSPKITPQKFKSAFTAAEGWGTFEQTQTSTQQSNAIKVAHGKLKLKRLVLAVDPEFSAENLRAIMDGDDLKIKFEQNGDRVQVVFDDEVIINSGKKLTVSMR
jgi:non-lysosomal glucosylceramidase